MGVENINLKLDGAGFIEVNDYFQTNVPSVYTMAMLLIEYRNPVALAEGMALAKKLFKPNEYEEVNYNLIPTAIFIYLI